MAKNYKASFTLSAFSEGFEAIVRDLQKVNTQIESFGRKMESAGKSLTLKLSVPLAGFAALAIKNFGDTEKALANLTNSLENAGDTSKSTFNAIINDADKLSKNSVFGKSDILNDVSAKLVQFRNIAGKTFPVASQLAVDLAAKFDTDLASAANIVGKALEQPADAINQLNRIGIKFTDQEEKQIETLLRANKGFEAQAIVIEKLTSRVDGAAAALSKTALGPLQTLRKNFADFTEQFGKAILETFNPYINKLNEVLVENSNLGNSFTRMAVKIGAIGIAIGPTLSAMGVFLKNISIFVNPITIAIAALIALTSGLQYLSDKFSYVSRILSAVNTITFSVVAVLALLTEAAITAARGYLEIGAAVEKITGADLGLTKLRDNLKLIEDEVRKFRQNTTNIANEEALNIIKGEKRNVVDITDLGFQEALDKVKSMFGKAGEESAGAFSNGAKVEFNGPDGTVKVVEDLTKKLNETGQILTNSFTTAFSTIAAGTESLGQSFKKLGQNIVNGLFSAAIQNAFTSLFAKLGFNVAATGFGNITGAPVQKAAGGLITGPGSPTSDSILTRLSNGEFVMQAKAVQKFGVNFMAAINRGLLPQFATGGMNFGNYLHSIPRYASGGIVNAQKPSVSVNVINNSSGPPVTAKSSQSFDVRGTIVNIILEDLKTNGPISQGNQQAFGLKR